MISNFLLLSFISLAVLTGCVQNESPNADNNFGFTANHLLLKEGTATSCHGYKIVPSYVNNYWNAYDAQGNKLPDSEGYYINGECEFKEGYIIDFLFKDHTQKEYTYTGSFEVIIRTALIQDGGSMEVYISKDANAWIPCGGFIDIPSNLATRSEICGGSNIKYIRFKINPRSAPIMFDRVEVVKV